MTPAAPEDRASSSFPPDAAPASSGPAPRRLDEAGLRERLAGKRELIASAEPFVSGLYDFVRGSGFLALLADGEGFVLSVVGDEDILGEAFGFGLLPGAFLGAGGLGFQALVSVLAGGRPVQAPAGTARGGSPGSWTCSAAPVRSPRGGIIACLALIGGNLEVHPHTLGMVVAASGAIETSLALAARNEALEGERRFSETLLDSITAGILSADFEGALLSANRHALGMFGFDRAELASAGLGGLLPGWPSIRAASMAGEELHGLEAQVEARSNRLAFDLSTYPLRDAEGRPRAVILVFKEFAKARRHAGEVLGRRAVYTFDKIVGSSPSLREAVEFARKIADGRSTILITGESGTGKEIFAQAIQNASPRRDEAFVVLNCGAIPATLIESELFGYVEGAFTGARRGGQVGKFEIADRGTIFLDEIGDMPSDMQTRLLRVIEEGTVTRVGDNREVPVDVRIIAATNQDLAAAVARGSFRKDLYYRLNVLPIHLPPLRERREDIPLLIEHYMRRVSKRLNRRPVPIGGEAMADLVERDWPGNVRELENFIELVIASEGLPPFLAPLSWRPEPRAAPGPLALEPGLPRAGPPAGPRPAAGSLREAERDLLERTLRDSGGNASLTARRLGIGRTTLYRKLHLHGLPPKAPGLD